MRTYISILLLLGSIRALQASDILSVADSADLKQARSSHLNLLTSAGGFEAAGSGPMTDLKLPVVGIMPSSLAATLSLKKGKFESSGKELPKIKKIETSLGATQQNYGFFLNYKVSDNLQLQCTGSRKVRRAPAGLKSSALPQTEVAEEDPDREIITASSSITRYGLVYPCTLYCTDSTAEFCETRDYIDSVVGKLQLLFPGKGEQ